MQSCVPASPGLNGREVPFPPSTRYPTSVTAAATIDVLPRIQVLESIRAAVMRLLAPPRPSELEQVAAFVMAQLREIDETRLLLRQGEVDARALLELERWQYSMAPDDREKVHELADMFEDHAKKIGTKTIDETGPLDTIAGDLLVAYNDQLRAYARSMLEVADGLRRIVAAEEQDDADAHAALAKLDDDDEVVAWIRRS